jgi:hypothetical protein
MPSGLLFATTIKPANNMKFRIIHLIFLFVGLSGMSLLTSAQDAATLRQQMAKIRQSTNWDDPAAAQKAYQKIMEITKKLMPYSPASNQVPTETGNEQSDPTEEMKSKLWSKIVTGAAGGVESDILIAEPVRTEIAEEYQEEEAPKKVNLEFFEANEVLAIDFAQPQARFLVEQMPNFRNIKTLILTTSKPGAKIQFDEVLSRASDYPLESLYIINFRLQITVLPEQIGQFSGLKTLAVFNNALSKLPASIQQLTRLETLYLDKNPLTTLLPVLQSLKNLKELGLAQTSVSSAEIQRIQQALPSCKILTK